MRMAATIAGIFWIVAIIVGAILLYSYRLLRGGRGDMALLFVAALPGILLIRWGRRNARRGILLSRRDRIVKKPARGPGKPGGPGAGTR
ncbi:MAG TPA: hypothetical protein VMU22_14790 [Rhizomicrobium sp.]|nr:hypothetical protein [Rhizomicrobium sp.]